MGWYRARMQAVHGIGKRMEGKMDCRYHRVCVQSQSEIAKMVTELSAKGYIVGVYEEADTSNPNGGWYVNYVELVK